jgi:hypothetical protein
MNYQKICKDCLKGLNQRTFDVVQRRFGLENGNKETLEAIGASYNITRERVRQIELEGLAKAKKDLEKNQDLAKHFEKAFNDFGGIKKETHLLQDLAGDKLENQVSFLLANINGFERVPEDNSFYSFWNNNKEVVNKAKKTIKLTINKLKKENKTLCLEDLSKGEKLKRNIFASYIGISKSIEKNPKGEFGLSNWIEINPKGVKDRAYLVFKREEKPLHFADLAFMIEKLPFPGPKKVHTATVHNELIKDSRFVLVGRGLYALKEWGYQPGIVKDIITKILKDSKKPLSRQEILKKVLAQRFVKENTIMLNLQDKAYFARNVKGKYTIKEA